MTDRPLIEQVREALPILKKTREQLLAPPVSTFEALCASQIEEAVLSIEAALAAIDAAGSEMETTAEERARLYAAVNLVEYLAIRGVVHALLRDFDRALLLRQPEKGGDRNTEHRRSAAAAQDKSPPATSPGQPERAPGDEEIERMAEQLEGYGDPPPMAMRRLRNEAAALLRRLRPQAAVLAEREATMKMLSAMAAADDALSDGARIRGDDKQMESFSRSAETLRSAIAAIRARDTP